MLLNSKHLSVHAICILSLVCAILLTPHTLYAQSKKPLRAYADLSGCADANISGTLLLEEEVSNEGVKLVQVTLEVTGLAPGTRHAVHIHETAACKPCSAAGGHFDPGPDGIISPDGNHPYHSGDLVNLKVDRVSTQKQIFRDEFNKVAFDNNDGNADFNRPWSEYDRAGAGPSAGVIRIANGVLSLNDYPNTNTQPGITRGADLSAAGKALLYFDYATTAGVDPGDEVSLEIAADGKNFTVLQKFTNIYGKTANSRRYDITKFMSANTRVRFRVTRLYGGPNEFFLVDNLTIEAHKVAAVGLMQAVTNRITLSPGPLSIFDSDGSALIVHVDPDTYCPKGEQAGCAGGARAACGIIQFVND